MLSMIPITKSNPKEACDLLLSQWKNDDIKVVVLKAQEDIDDVKHFYESLFPHMGSAAKLAEDARITDRGSQRTGEVWMEIRFDPKIKDAYRHSSEAQPLHTDGSYIPNFPNSSLLCCVQNAGAGGETVFINASQLVEILKRDDPELFDILTSETMPHSRSGDTRNEKVLSFKDGVWRVNWNFYCVAENVSDSLREAADRFHNFLKSNPSILESLQPVKLEPGDAVLWKDNEVLHGRNSFEATQESERFIWKCAFDVGNFN